MLEINAVLGLCAALMVVLRSLGCSIIILMSMDDYD